MKITKEDVRRIMADIMEVELSEIQDNTLLVEDLDADSLKAIEILVALEQEYQLKIPEKYVKRFLSLEEVMKVIEEVLEGQQ